MSVFKFHNILKIISIQFLLILSACISSSDDSIDSNSDTTNETTSDINETNGSDNNNDNTDSTTTCDANDAGNGDVLIDGPSGPEGADTDNPFRSLTVHPSNPAIVLLGTERNGFVKSIDGGSNWSRYRQGLRHDGGYAEIWDIAFNPSHPNIVYAATLDSSGPVTGNYPSSIAGVYKSTDGGETWARSNCGLNNSRITSIKVSGIDGNIVLIGVEGGSATFSELLGQYFNGGIYRSTDAGANWSKLDIHSNDIKNGYWWLQVYGNSNQHFISFALNYNDLNENLGFIKSIDDGINWTLMNSTLKNLSITGFDISTDGQTVYANERDTYKIRISTDGGSTWDTTAINQANGPVAVSPGNPQLVIYSGSSIIYRTNDGFASAPQAVLSAADTISDIVFSPSDQNMVYAVSRGYLVYKSTDAGASFSLIKNIRSDVLNNN